MMQTLTPPKEKLREQLTEDIESFLAGGGEITTLPPKDKPRRRAYKVRTSWDFALLGKGVSDATKRLLGQYSKD